MSKFSEALKKIEQERKPRAVKPADENAVPVLQMVDGAGEAKISWEAGMQKMKNAKPDHRVVMYHFPDSLITEQYRMLRTSLKTRLKKEGIQVLMVSSSIHGEGKSLTSVNLALSLVEEEDAKVLLIDADLRRGKIHEYLGMGSERRGLADLLKEDSNPKTALYQNSHDNFTIMPRGTLCKNPSSLISSQRFRMLMAEMRSHYHYIIIDAPPIMSVADPGIMARDVDGVLFVIQVGRTPKSMIAHSNQLFKQSGAKLVGYVLTNVEFQSSEYRYYKKYYEHYSNSDKRGMKDFFRRGIQATGFNFESAEKKLTDWWQGRGARKSK